LHDASRLARHVLCAALLASVSHTVCAFTVAIAPAAPKPTEYQTSCLNQAWVYHVVSAADSLAMVAL